MGDCSLGFTADDKARLDKLCVDMWEGRGVDNPSVTTRLRVLEEERGTVNKVHIALFGDGQEVEGLIVKFEKAISFFKGSIRILSVMGVIALALFSYFLTQIVPAAKFIIDDYYSHHPAAKRALNDPQKQQADYLSSDKFYHIGGNDAVRTK